MCIQYKVGGILGDSCKKLISRSRGLLVNVISAQIF